MTHIHKKTGNYYEIIDDDIIGAGELCRGNQFTLYTRDGSLYVREQNDFNAKFEEMKR